MKYSLVYVFIYLRFKVNLYLITLQGRYFQYSIYLYLNFYLYLFIYL